MQSFKFFRYRRVDLSEQGSTKRVEGLTVTGDHNDHLRESIAYSADVPYSIINQRYKRTSIIELHFGETLEIMMLQNLHGEIICAGRSIKLNGSPQLIIIPPRVLHSGRITPEGEGFILNLKFSLREMNRFINLESMLAAEGKTLEQLIASHPSFDEVLDATLQLAYADERFWERMHWCLRLFELFCKGIPQNIPSAEKCDISENEKLHQLVTWTEEHFRERITVDDAARMMNLSKCYFCKYFKQKTQYTYMAYLTSVRINHAKTLLLSGSTAEEACYECGFDNVPYFIQLFKKQTGFTTREFRNHFASVE